MYGFLFLSIIAFTMSLMVSSAGSMKGLRQISSVQEFQSVRWPSVGQAMVAYHEAANRILVIETGRAAANYPVGIIAESSVLQQTPEGWNSKYPWLSQVILAGTDYYLVTAPLNPFPSFADTGEVLRSAWAFGQVKPRVGVVVGGLFTNYQTVVGQVKLGIGGVANPTDPYANAPSETFPVPFPDGTIALATRLRSN